MGTIWGPHVVRDTARRQRSRTSCTVHNVFDVQERVTPFYWEVKGSRVQIPPSRLGQKADSKS
jgi:hypothetical protein